AVPNFFALSQGYFDLGDSVTEINLGRYDGQALGFGADRELVNFVFVEEKLARAEGFVIPGAAGHVLGDVGVHEPRTVGLEVDIGVADVRFALAQRLHFGAAKGEAGFKAFEEVVIVGGGAILRDDRLGGLLGLFRRLLALRWNGGPSRLGDRLRHSVPL